MYYFRLQVSNSCLSSPKFSKQHSRPTRQDKVEQYPRHLNLIWVSSFRPKTSTFIISLNSHSCPHFTTRALQGMLSQYRGSKSRSSLEAATPRTSEDGEQPQPTVLPSSTELFYFYAQSLEQCAKLFTGQPLFDLCQLHKKWLRIYAGRVALLTILHAS